MKKIILISLLFLTTAGIANAQTWTQKANISGFGRRGPVGFAIGSKGYAGLGLYDPTQTLLNDFWEYDPVTDAWTQKANFAGTPRFCASAFVIGNFGYVGIGSDGYPLCTFPTDFWKYDPLTNTWTAIANFIATGRYNAPSFVIGNNAYCGTGWDQAQYLSDFYEYNSTTNTWSVQTSYPGGQVDAGVAGTIGNFGYMGLGFDGTTIHSDFYKFDPTTSTWTAVANMPSIDFNGASFVLNNKIYAGTGGISFSPIVLISNFWAYDPATNIWAAIPSMPGGSRLNDIAFAIGCNGYCGSGSDSTVTNNLVSFWAYGDNVTATAAANPMNICLGDSIAFTSTNTGATSTLWNFGDGSLDSVNANPYHTYLAAGNYTVTFHAISPSCSSDSVTLNVTVSAGSVASFTPVVTPCNLSVSFTNTSTGANNYSWSFGDGGTSIVANPAHLYTGAGTYQVTLITGSGLCADTAIQSITINSTIAVNLGPDQNVCTGHSIILNAGNTDATYLWNNNLTTQTIVVTTPGIYSVTVTDGPCTGVDSVIITYSPGPVALPSAYINLCPGIDTTLNAGNPGMSYLWSTGATTQTISTDFQGVYFVQVSNVGCMAADTMTIKVYPQLLINQSNDTAICPGAQLLIVADGGKAASNYYWNPGGENADNITVYQPGTYLVTIKDTNGCLTSRSIYVGEFCFNDLYVPSAFSPNGDGLNELFLAYGDSIQNFQMYVFDRWGEQIFTSNNIAQGWDGKYLGNLVSQGVYVYVIEYATYDYNELQNHKKVGSVTLMR